MNNGSHYVGLKELVQDLSRTLARAPLNKTFNDAVAVRRWMRPIVREFLVDKLGSQNIQYDFWPLYTRSWANVLPTTAVFGASFMPDFAIDITEVPTVAILATFIADPRTLGARFGSAIGQGIILSHTYPSVISFILDSVGQRDRQRWVEREIKLDLWSRHKVMLVVREHPSTNSSQEK